MTIENDNYRFKKLIWDTEHLGLDTFELLLKNNLDENEIQQIKFIFDIKGLIYIKNLTKNRENSKFIGLFTSAVLYDTNVFFKCKLQKDDKLALTKYDYNICSTLRIDIEEFAGYDYSRFNKDIAFKEKSRTNIYSEWIKNAQSVDSKKFLTLEIKNVVLGYVLYSINETFYTIELISIKKEHESIGLGTILIEYIKQEALKNNIYEIFVGTQISNIKALNFYIKNGFYIVSTTDIYHWWKK